MSLQFAIQLMLILCVLFPVTIKYLLRINLSAHNVPTIFTRSIRPDAFWASHSHTHIKQLLIRKHLHNNMMFCNRFAKNEWDIVNEIDYLIHHRLGVFNFMGFHVWELPYNFHFGALINEKYRIDAILCHG